MLPIRKETLFGGFVEVVVSVKEEDFGGFEKCMERLCEEMPRGNADEDRATSASGNVCSWVLAFILVFGIFIVEFGGALLASFLIYLTGTSSVFTGFAVSLVFLYFYLSKLPWYSGLRSLIRWVPVLYSAYFTAHNTALGNLHWSALFIYAAACFATLYPFFKDEVDDDL